MTTTGRPRNSASAKSGGHSLTLPASFPGFPGGSFQARLYHPALAGAPPEEGNWNHPGGSFQAPLYHLHPRGRVHK